MERIILDTSVAVAQERGGRSLSDFIPDSDDVAVAAVTSAELLVGVERAGGRQRAQRSHDVERLLASVSCLPYDLAVARVHASLMAHVADTGTRRGAHDLIIAATAKAHDRTVVTLDRRSFEGLPGVVVRAN